MFQAEKGLTPKMSAIIERPLQESSPVEKIFLPTRLHPWQGDAGLALVLAATVPV